MSHIFISYSHQDQDYAYKLYEYFISRGLDAWIDKRIAHGAEWPQVLQEKVDTCDAFIVIMSPQSYESSWVQKELARAQSKEKPIFPFLLEGDEPWMSVQNIQYVDVRGAKLPPSEFNQALGGVLVEQLKQRGEKLPTVIKLFRIESGRDLVDIFAGHHASLPTHSEPKDEDEMYLIKDLLDTVMELDTIEWFDAGARVEIAFSLSKKIEELKASGLYVYAAKTRRNVQTSLGVLENAEMALINIARANVEFTVFFFFDN